ncbi:MAG TPA: hypothetical protein VE999_03160 [Gemmataceae bacterium]|nr:hypothetical protein [Gemmataceae bacterium]
MSPLSWRQWIKNCVAARKLPRANASRKRPQTSVLLHLEALEDRITPSNVTWTGGGDGQSWGDGKNWNTGAVPGISDDVTINKTGVGTINIAGSNYSVRSLNDTTAVLSIASGASLSLAAVALSSTFGQNVAVQSGGTLTVEGGTSTFDQNVAVLSGGMLTVEAGASVVVGGGVTLTDDGTLKFSSGDSVSLSAGATQIVVGNGGLMTATGTTFSGPSNYVTQIVVNSGGHLQASNSIFALYAVILNDGSTLNAGDLTGNSFNSPLFVPEQDIQNLSNNALFNTINILGGSVAGGKTLALNAIGKVSTANLVYNFAGNFLIGSQGTVTVAPNVSVVVGEGVTLTDDGTLNFKSGDNVALNIGTTQIVVGNGGLMTATDTTFSGATNYVTQIVVNSGGHLQASNSIFALYAVMLNDGSTLYAGDLTGNFFNTTLYTPIADVPLLTNNKSFDAVYINAGDSLASGKSVSLALMGSLSTASLAYFFAGDLAINTGAALTVGTDVTVTGNGNLSIAGSLNVNGGTLNDKGNLSNTGTISLNNGTLTVAGTVAQLSSSNALTAGTWNVGPSSNLDFASGSNITSLTGAQVTLNGANSDFAALANLGTIAAGSSFSLLGGQNFTTAGDLSNAGSLTLSGGILTDTGNLSNTGTLSLSNATLTVAGSVAQLSSSHALTAGRWTVGPSSNLDFASGSSITSLAGAQVTLNGTDSNFLALTNLNTIIAGSIFSLLGGRSFTTAGDLSSAGGIILNTATLNVSGNLTNTGGLIWTNATVNVADSLSNTGRLNLNGSTLTVKGAVAQLSSNALTAGTWNIGPSSTLNFAAGSKITSLAGAQVTLNGANSTFAALANLNTIASNSSLILEGGQTFTTASNLTNAGSLSVFGGTLNVTGNLSNTGSINLNSGDLTVTGTVAQLSGTSLTAGVWMVGPSSTLNFAAGSNITSLAGAQVMLNGANSNFAALANLASIAKGSSLLLLGGQSFATVGDLSNGGTLTLIGGTLSVAGSLSNTGNLNGSNATVQVSSNLSNTGAINLSNTTLNVTGNLSNLGSVSLSSSTLSVAGSVTQLVGNVLKGGAWYIGPNSNLKFAAGSSITSLAGAQVTLNGANSNFAALANLNTIAAGSSLSLLGGQSFTTTGNFTNNGKLTVGAGSVLTATGSFTQASTAALSIQLGGSNNGQVVSTTGTVTLGGTLQVRSTVVPAVGSSFEILANEGGSAISGTFAGLAEGGTFLVTSGSTTMTFQISYKGDGGNNVTIARIS